MNQSAPPYADLTPDCVLDALDALQWPSANLLGHSMGGAIASMVAAAVPQRVTRLALIEALGPVSGKAADRFGPRPVLVVGALALGAGTQAFTVGFGEALFGAGVVRHDLMMGAGWAINLAVAEWIIRRPSARLSRSTRTGTRAALVGS